MGYLIAVSLVWAFSFGLIKTILTGLDPGFVAWARMLVALPLFLPWLRARGLGPRLIAGLLAIGAVQYGLMYMLYIAAYQRLSAHEVALLTVFTPIYVALVHDALARRVAPRTIALALLAALGAGVIESGDVALDPVDARARWVGVLLVQAANLCFAAGQVLYRALRRRRAELEDHRVFALLYLGALLVTSVGTTLRGGWSSAAALSGEQLTALLYLGAVASGLCFFAWNKGAVTVSPATLAVFNNLKVPLAVAAALLVFGEQADVGRLLVGGALLVVAAAGALSEKPATRAPADGQGRKDYS